jgi:hypothetical protein
LEYRRAEIDSVRVGDVVLGAFPAKSIYRRKGGLDNDDDIIDETEVLSTRIKD